MQLEVNTINIKFLKETSPQKNPNDITRIIFRHKLYTYNNNENQLNNITFFPTKTNFNTHTNSTPYNDRPSKPKKNQIKKNHQQEISHRLAGHEHITFLVWRSRPQVWGLGGRTLTSRVAPRGAQVAGL